MPRSRDYHAEYERRQELARERGYKSYGEQRAVIEGRKEAPPTAVPPKEPVGDRAAQEKGYASAKEQFKLYADLAKAARDYNPDLSDRELRQINGWLRMAADEVQKEGKVSQDVKDMLFGLEYLTAGELYGLMRKMYKGRKV